MSMKAILHADGSAAADAHETVVADREAERYRWTCPNGHTSWDATNSHIWCPECRRQIENGSPQVEDAEHWEVVDLKTGETIPFSAVEVVE